MITIIERSFLKLITKAEAKGKEILQLLLLWMEKKERISGA